MSSWISNSSLRSTVEGTHGVPAHTTCKHGKARLQQRAPTHVHTHRDLVVLEVIGRSLLVKLPAQEAASRPDVAGIRAGSHVPRLGVVANVRGLLALAMVRRELVKSTASM